MSPADVRAEIASLLNGNGRQEKPAVVKAPARPAAAPAKAKPRKR
jgi:hypothetical protein